MRHVSRLLALLPVLIAMLTMQPAIADEPAEQPAPEVDIRGLANEVDVLLLANELRLTEAQIKYIVGRMESLHKQREEARKKEEAILQEIKEPLQNLRNALVAGQDVPGSIAGVTASKLRDLQTLRLGTLQEFEAAVIACTRLLSEGQMRTIARSPEAVRRAQQMVQQVRSASEGNWPATMQSLASELVEVKKIDKLEEWQTEMEEIQRLPEEQRDDSFKEFEKRRDESISGMRSEATQLLTSIRGADARVLSVGVNNLASALRSQVEVRAQLYDMIGSILNNPKAKDALNARLEIISTASEEQ